MAAAQPARAMAAAAAGENKNVWLWTPCGRTTETTFKHPACIPHDDEALARKYFIENLRGPRIASFRPVTRIKQTAKMTTIADKGATRDVPSHMVLSFFEGLLILQSLEKPGCLPTSGWDQEHTGVLNSCRGKLLDMFPQMIQKLTHIAITGPSMNFRRSNVRNEDKSTVQAMDVEIAKHHGFKDFLDYKPPWEAFCHPKCGFYQDFYLVKWESPYSEIDYSSVENGEGIGTTWEPDEIISTSLDPFRLSAKKVWLQREQNRLKQESNGKGRPEVVASPPPPPQHRAKRKRDDTPLAGDFLFDTWGSDFDPQDLEPSGTELRAKWPKTPEEYPPGFTACRPPGYCFRNCDCMDDARVQQAWEMNKKWIEDVGKTEKNRAAMRNFEQLPGVVRRGLVSGQMHRYETVNRPILDLRRPNAAVDLASLAEQAIKEVLHKMPVSALAPETEPVKLPLRIFNAKEENLEPCRVRATLPAKLPGDAPRALPSWVRIDADDWRITVSREVAEGSLPMTIDLDIHFSDGEGPKGQITVVDDTKVERAFWLQALVPVVERFHNVKECSLDALVRRALKEKFDDLYDFTKREPLAQSLGQWLKVMYDILTRLRVASGMNVNLATSSSSTPRSSPGGSSSRTPPSVTPPPGGPAR